MAVKGANASYREFRPTSDLFRLFLWQSREPVLVIGSSGQNRNILAGLGEVWFENGSREPARPCCFPAAGCFLEASDLSPWQSREPDREFRPKPDYPIMGSDAFENGPREPAGECCFNAEGCFFLDL